MHTTNSVRKMMMNYIYLSHLNYHKYVNFIAGTSSNNNQQIKNINDQQKHHCNIDGSFLANSLT